MSKATEIEVKVTAKLDVDEKTAFTCLHLLEIYVNKQGLVVLPIRTEDGNVELSFMRIPKDPKICPCCGRSEDE